MHDRKMSTDEMAEEMAEVETGNVPYEAIYKTEVKRTRIDEAVISKTYAS